MGQWWQCRESSQLYTTVWILSHHLLFCESAWHNITLMYTLQHNITEDNVHVCTCQKMKCSLMTSFTLSLLHTSRLRTWEANSLESWTLTSTHFCLCSPAWRAYKFVFRPKLTYGTCKSSRGLFQVLAQGGANGHHCSPQPVVATFCMLPLLAFLWCRRKHSQTPPKPYPLMS